MDLYAGSGLDFVVDAGVQVQQAVILSSAPLQCSAVLYALLLTCLMSWVRHSCHRSCSGMIGHKGSAWPWACQDI